MNIWPYTHKKVTKKKAHEGATVTQEGTLKQMHLVKSC